MRMFWWQEQEMRLQPVSQYPKCRSYVGHMHRLKLLLESKSLFVDGGTVSTVKSAVSSLLYLWLISEDASNATEENTRNILLY